MKDTSSESSKITGTSSQTGSAVEHEQFWFHDGSIIIRVEAVLFRVHQTVLSCHSKFFSDLFAVPQPKDGRPSVKGCPIVRLQDNADDFVNFLGAIYNPQHFDTIDSLEAGLGALLNSISGILRLSTKYLVPALRQKGISLLKLYFPITFADYNSLPRKRHRAKADDVMQAINLAHELNIPEILPTAYYRIARLDLKRILLDGPDDISWKDKTRCLVGRERLRLGVMSFSHSFLYAFQQSAQCSWLLCGRGSGLIKEWRDIEGRSPDPLKQYTRWTSLNVCPACVSHCWQQHESGRAEVFEHLPRWFGLPPWEELRASQDVFE